MTYTVYKGMVKGKIVYIGTTIQNPSARFRWHKANGKPFHFQIMYQYDNEKEMLEKEFELIKKIKPRYNKITHRIQNFNKKLTSQELESRKGDNVWCQSCFKRRVNQGYKTCLFCSRGQ